MLSAIKNGTAIDSAAGFAAGGVGRSTLASPAAVGPYALVRSHSRSLSRDGSVTSTSSVTGLVGRGEGNGGGGGGVEMMGFV